VHPELPHLASDSARRHRPGRRGGTAGRRRAKSRARGSYLTETVLILPPLLLLTFGVLDFSFLLHARLALANGVSEATRFAATGRTMAGTTSRAQAIIVAVQKATPSVPIQASNVSFYNLTKATADPGGPNDVIRVTVTYPWPLLTPVLRPFFRDGQVVLQISSTMKNEPFPAS
jgi:Flp pilus assembly protein TadG